MAGNGSVRIKEKHGKSGNLIFCKTHKGIKPKELKNQDFFTNKLKNQELF